MNGHYALTFQKLVLYKLTERRLSHEHQEGKLEISN